MNRSFFQVAERIISDLPSSRFVRRAIALMALAGGACFAPLAANAQDVLEQEPNDVAANAKVLDPGQFGLGVITTAGAGSTNQDLWGCSVTQGDLIFAYVDTQSSLNRATFIRFIRGDGVTSQEFDITDGPPSAAISGSALGGVVAASTENAFYLVDSNCSCLISPYRLYQAVVSPAQSGSEQEGNDTSATATPITARIMTGTVSGNDVDFYKVFVSINQRLVVIMDDNPDNDSTNTDTELSILGIHGTTTLAVGDNLGSGAPLGTSITGDANAAGAIVAPSTGIYYIRVAHGGEAGALDTDYRFVALVDGATVVDRDTDGVSDDTDNCPTVTNADQADSDGDGVGDACEALDTDGDGVVDGSDNCPNVANADQANNDSDARGNACDNCLNTPNADQADTDGDGIGDVCEAEGCGACGAGAPVMIGLTLPVLLIWNGLRRWRRKMRSPH